MLFVPLDFSGFTPVHMIFTVSDAFLHNESHVELLFLTGNRKYFTCNLTAAGKILQSQNHMHTHPHTVYFER